jgi:hypothetical protein
MKLLDANLLAVTGNTYDQNRTTFQGRLSTRTIDSKTLNYTTGVLTSISYS